MFNRITAILNLCIAVVQIIGITNKIGDAAWQWYKFYGYSNDGFTTIGINMLLLTYMLSVFFIAIGIMITKKSKDKPACIMAKTSSIMLSIGVFCLTLLVVSPFSHLVAR